jgi:hypothetical protein
MRNKKILTDECIMTYGKKHIGKTMEEVPAEHLMFIWNNSSFEDRTKLSIGLQSVLDYIEDNLEVLENETSI